MEQNEGTKLFREEVGMRTDQCWSRLLNVSRIFALGYCASAVLYLVGSSNVFVLITLSIVIAALVLMNISECYFAAKVGKNEKPMVLAVVMLCLVGILFWQVWATGKSEPVNMNTSTYSWDVYKVNSSSEFKVNVTFVNGDWGTASVDASGGNKESMFVNEADLQKIRNGAASYMLVNKRTSTRLNRLFLIRDVETDSITHTLKAV